MDIQRAQEIVESPVMVNVTHNDIQVYIQRVDSKSEIARIYPLTNPEDEKEVPIRNLIEH